MPARELEVLQGRHQAKRQVTHSGQMRALEVSCMLASAGMPACTGRRRVGSAEVWDLVSSERERSIADHTARTRRGADLEAVSLRPGSDEEVRC